MEIGCLTHGVFLQPPVSHVYGGHGCLKCAGLYHKTNDEFIVSAKEVRDGRSSYNKTIFGRASDKVIITCRIHGDWLQDPSSHLLGFGCKYCAVGSVSKQKMVWLDTLGVPQEMRQKKIMVGRQITVDGFDPSSNTIYEYLGDFWHGNPRKFNPSTVNEITGTTHGEAFQKTIDRLVLLDFLNYKVKYVWEKDFKEGRMFSNDLNFEYHACWPDRYKYLENLTRGN